MTIVKQKSVTESAHARNLRNYIDDKDALLRDWKNILTPERWFGEMSRMRKHCGHDRPARQGSANTIMYHQVIAFLPEEADFNGGPMVPELCMRYAKEYAEARYPDQQIAFALHREHCDADGTDRYAVHLAINRSNVRTGLRLDEGRSAQAKRDRARTVRELDAEWGLHQVEQGVPNSKLHRQQPQRRGAEKRITDRAKVRGDDPARASYKYNLRELCRLFRDRSMNLGEYRDMLAQWGVETEIKDGKIYAIDTDNRKYTFSLARLDRSLTLEGLEAAFKRNDDNRRLAALEGEIREKQRQIEAYTAVKKDYLSVVEERYRDYCALARPQKGARFEEIPNIKMPRVPAALQKDMDVKRTVLSYAFKGDELRAKLSRDAPKAPPQRQATSSGSPSAYRPVQSEPQRQTRRNRGAR